MICDKCKKEYVNVKPFVTRYESRWKGAMLCPICASKVRYLLALKEKSKNEI